MTTPEVVVAGHTCLDIIPDFRHHSDLQRLLQPGNLVLAGSPVISTGGAACNTGIALRRLGVTSRVVARVGADPFGDLILSLLRRYGSAMADGVIVVPCDQTSYCVVISAPGFDRMFLYFPGANDTFAGDDVRREFLTGARIFHFGYPSTMRRMFLNEGAECARMFRRIKNLGLTTSLDMTRPDPDSEAGRADWPCILKHLLPHVDLLLPSLDEMAFMLRCAGGVREIADRLLGMGPAIVLLKMGEQGAYLKTTSDGRRLASIGLDPATWQGKEVYESCFEVKAAGATGAGDATIAGFLAAILRGQSAEDALTSAAAVGACCVERPDSVSGIPPWEEVQERIAAGWRKRETGLSATVYGL